MGDAEDTVSCLGPIASDAARSAILLDLDGTLAPIVERPADVRITDAIRALLPALASRYGMVAFVSGRAVAQLERIVDLPGVAYSGNHGAEIRLRDGRRLPVAQAEAELPRLRAFAGEWPTRVLKPWGVWLEDKGATLTFHYRTADDPERAAQFLQDTVASRARAAGLIAEPGRMSLEIHPAVQVNKGTAARALLETHPEIHRALSIGDDRTDVTIWRELRRLVDARRLKGAVAVGVRSDESPPEVIEEADVLVDGVDGAAHVLELLL